MDEDWKTKIAEIQDATGWSLRTMAERTGIPVYTLSRITNRPDYAVSYSDGSKLQSLFEATVQAGVRVQ